MIVRYGIYEGSVAPDNHARFNQNMEEFRRERLLEDWHRRIRDVRQGPDELLYLLTDEDDGAIIRIEPAG